MTPSATTRALVWCTLLLALLSGGCRPRKTAPSASAPDYQRDYTAGPVSVRVVLDHQQLSMAQHATLTVTVKGPEETVLDITLPATEDFIINQRPAADSLDSDGRLITTQEAELNPFLPGDFTLAAITIGPPDKPLLTTDPITISVHSLAADGQTDIMAILPPRPLPQNHWLWPVAGGITLLVCGLLLFLLRRRRRQPPPPPPPIPPDRRAIRALDDLLAAGHLDRGLLEPFICRLTDILRRYLEERFALRAPEQTSEEFLRDPRLTELLNLEQRQGLEQFLSRADLIKFARRQPTIHECREAMDQCRQFILETAGGPALAPEEEA